MLQAARAAETGLLRRYGDIDSHRLQSTTYLLSLVPPSLWPQRPYAAHRSLPLPCVILPRLLPTCD
jgi:hypothetical protein